MVPAMTVPLRAVAAAIADDDPDRGAEGVAREDEVAAAMRMDERRPVSMVPVVLPAGEVAAMVPAVLPAGEVAAMVPAVLPAGKVAVVVPAVLEGRPVAAACSRYLPR
jgi:hypothetical protein